MILTATSDEGGECPKLDLASSGWPPDGHTGVPLPRKRRREGEDEALRRPWLKNQVVPCYSHPPGLQQLSLGDLPRGRRDKAETLHEVLEAPEDPDRFPAQAIRPTAGRLTWMVDRAAHVF